MPINSFASNKLKMLLGATVALGALSAPQVSADDDFLSVSANAALVSEYRFRGISLSDKDIAMQGGFDVSTSSGFYVGTWGSSIDQYGDSELELDVYGGYATEVGAVTVDVGILGYTYPGDASLTYWEVYSKVSGTAGKVDWKAGAAYVWDQDSTGNQDNIYLSLDAGMPIEDTPFSLAGHVAYEDGAFGDNKWDWNIGVAYEFKSYTFTVSYVDTANTGGTHGSLGDAAIVGMLSASF